MNNSFISQLTTEDDFDLLDDNFDDDYDLLLIDIGDAEVVYLEDEDYAEAKEISDKFTEEPQQWQIYLNILALRALEIWLSEQINKIKLSRDECTLFKLNPLNLFNTICNLKVGDFKICLIVIKSFSKEVTLPQTVINSPMFACHFYVAIEVLEDEEQALLRGIIRYDQLMILREQGNFKLQGEFYRLPLACFDSKVDHLLAYLNHLNVSAIRLPTIIKLSNWLQGIPELTWYNSEDLLTRQQLHKVYGGQPIDKRVKNHNFVVNLVTYRVVLEVSILKESEKQAIVNSKVYPYDRESSTPNTLPPNLKLIVLAEGEVFDEVTARNNDLWIQCEVDAKFGEEFIIQLELEGMKIEEYFIV